MTRFDWERWAQRECDGIRAAGRWRSPRSFDASGPIGALAGTDGDVVSFASNDYLGLTQHPVVVAAARVALERWGSGSGAARLVVGSRPPHHQLEARVAEWKGAEAAVLFPTGFAANIGALSALAPPGTTILSDELNHASIVDGCRLARADVEVYPHSDLDQLAKRLDACRGPAVVVTDTVFSMDGDVVDVESLLPLCADHGALLILDEAHAVLGPELPATHGPVLRVGTLSKTLGSLGGFVAASASMCDLLVNRARSYIFTTASTPADTAAAIAALEIVRSPEGGALRSRLRANVELLAPGHPSPIVPLVVGAEDDAVEASRALLGEGFLVPAIRPPTVPPGTSRLRVALSAAHHPEQVRALVDALDRLGLRR
jgi:8-amino-7-oxononanoate synthase